MKPSISFNPDTHNLKLDGLFEEPVCFNIVVRYMCRGIFNTWTVRDSEKQDKTQQGWRFTGKDIALDVLFEENPEALTASMELTNISGQKIHLAEVYPAIIELDIAYFRDLENIRLFQNGYQSWTPTSSVSADTVQKYPKIKSFGLMNHYVDSPFWGKKDGLISSLFTVIKRYDQDIAFLLGYLSQNTGLGEIFLKNRGKKKKIYCSLDYGHKLLDINEKLAIEPLWISKGQDNAIIEEYTSKFGLAMKARTREKIAAGWCSWYEFYTSVSENNILENAEHLAQMRPMGVEFIQLDDGYQNAVGDWLLLNQKFPSGLKKLASCIHERGFNAGIWLAPFFASSKSMLFKDHPEWFLKNRKGKLVYCGYNSCWKTKLYALDLTNPDYLAWLLSLFKELVSLGFTYFKIDFIFAGLRHGKRFNPGYSPVEAYRHGLETIRAAIGEESFLLGCGAPIGPSVGFVDAMRVSEDVKEIWISKFWEWLGTGCGVPSLRGSLRNNINRYFMNRRFWINDPDCILVRDTNTCLNSDEVQMLVTVLGMSGGLLFLSDNLSTLKRDRFELALAILPQTRLCGTTDLLMQSPYPERFWLTNGDKKLLAILNWDNTLKTHSLKDYFSPDECTVFDFWNQNLILDSEITLKPHSACALIILGKESSPSPVGTSLNLAAMTDGRIIWHFNQEAKELLIKCQETAKPSGKLWINIPENLIFDSIMANTNVEVSPWEKGIIVELKNKDKWEIRLKFS